MMTQQTFDTRQLPGHTAFDRDYLPLGTIDAIWINGETRRPEGLTIAMGLFGTKLRFVPLGGAAVCGDDVIVPFDAPLIRDAPKFECDGHLEPEEVTALFEHYGLLDASRPHDGQHPRSRAPHRSARWAHGRREPPASHVRQTQQLKLFDPGSGSERRSRHVRTKQHAG